MNSGVVAILALDVGASRIGVAKADTGVKIAFPLETLTVDGTEFTRIQALLKREDAHLLVVGYPRNQSGEPTAQTDYVTHFAERLRELGVSVVFQDESVTSVIAEQRLIHTGKPYTKGMIDAEAAAIILQDYLETNHGH